VTSRRLVDKKRRLVDKKGTLEALFQFSIASEMYSGQGHIIKYGQEHVTLYTSSSIYIVSEVLLTVHLTTEPNLDFKCGKFYLIWLVILI
jgi:hypothetical protein